MEQEPKFRSRFGVLLAAFIVGFAAVVIASGAFNGGVFGTVVIVIGSMVAFVGAAGFAVELSRPKEEGR